MSRGNPKEQGFTVMEVAIVIAVIAVMLSSIMISGKFAIEDAKVERTARELTALAHASTMADARSWDTSISGVSPIYSKSINQNIYGGSNSISSNGKYVAVQSDISGREGIISFIPFGEEDSNQVRSYFFIFNKRLEGIRFTNKALCRQDCAQRGCSVCVSHCRQLKACDVYNNVCSGGPSC